MCNCQQQRIRELEVQAEADRAEIAELFKYKHHRECDKIFASIGAVFLLISGVIVFALVIADHKIVLNIFK